MLRRMCFLMLITFACNSHAADDAPATLTVSVGYVLPHQGEVVVSLFDQKKAYMKNPVLVRRVPVSDSDRVVVTLGDIDIGDYAISVYYDEDGNGKLNTGLFRIPKEPIGFSNNARGKFGPAKWDYTNFRIDGDLEISIDLYNAVD